MSIDETQSNPRESKLGRLAFAYCKIATFSLLAGRFTLPLAALLSASFFIISYVQGKKDTKCYLRYPLMAVGFWLVILAIWIGLHIFPNLAPDWLKYLHGF